MEKTIMKKIIMIELGCSFIGLFVWLIINSQSGWEALSGGIMMAITILGYKMSKKKITIKVIIICAVLCLVTILVGEYILVGTTIHYVFESQGVSMMDALIKVPSFLGFSNVLNVTLNSVLIGYMGVGITGIASYVICHKKRI